MSKQEFRVLLEAIQEFTWNGIVLIFQGVGLALFLLTFGNIMTAVADGYDWPPQFLNYLLVGSSTLITTAFVVWKVIHLKEDKSEVNPEA